MVVESLDFNSIFANLYAAGFYDFLLPFLLVFTIIFAVLEKTKLMGVDANSKAKTNINVLLALIIGMIVIVQTDIVHLMNNYLSKMALFIVIVLIFMLVLGIFGADVGKGITGGITGFIAFLLTILAVIWALSPELGFGDFFNKYYIFTDADKALLLFIGVFLLVIWMVTKEPSTNDNIAKRIGDAIFGGNAGRRI